MPSPRTQKLSHWIKAKYEYDRGKKYIERKERELALAQGPLRGDL
jgi:hypothetical protein